MHQLFDPSAVDSARLNIIRLPLSSTDISYSSNDPKLSSRTNWVWADAAHAPPDLMNAISVIRDAIALNPGITVIAIAWSAPVGLKTDIPDPNRPLYGGKLAAGRKAAYGNLLVAQAKALIAMRVPLSAMTLGNEPGNSDSRYPTMTMTDDQMGLLARSVSHRFKDMHVGLWALDHNWVDAARVPAIVGTAPGAFQAAAFHCYNGGSPGMMANSPVPPIMTECTGSSKDDWPGTFTFAETLVISAAENGSMGNLMWNLALNASYGPKIANTCTGDHGECRGLLKVPGTGTAIPDAEFFVLGQVARAAQPGAHRIDLGGQSSVIKAVAFQNLDGTVGVFGHNNSTSPQVVGIAGAIGQAETAFTVGPSELFSFRSKVAVQVE